MHDPITETNTAAAKQAQHTTIAATLRGLAAILGNDYELPDWGGITVVSDDEVRLELIETTYCCGDRDTETQHVTFTFDELVNADLDLAAIAKARWKEAHQASLTAAQKAAEEQRATEERNRKAAAAAALAAKQKRAATLAAVEAQAPETVATLRAAGLLSP